MNRFRRCILFFIAGGLLVCILGALISALSNRGLPSVPASLDVMTDLDKARLAEALHLKQLLGAEIWPGLGEADIPVLLWNRGFSFLVNFPAAPDGWEEVAGDSFLEQAYYRQPTDDHQNFAVEVGGQWVASLGTKWETDAFMMEMFQDVLPPVIEDIFPYRLLILPSEVQITGVLHESFHVYQMQVAPERLAAAEASHQSGDSYWQVDEAMHAEWEREIHLLRQALESGSDQQAAEYVRQFLEARQERRSAHSLSSEFIIFEQAFEWEEGLAKYVELESWRRAYESGGGYVPVSGMEEDPEFKGYRTFKQRWSQELSQMERQANRAGDTRFYYTGMAQAKLLDHLMPDWKTRILGEVLWLDRLLAEAISPQ